MNILWKLILIIFLFISGACWGSGEPPEPKLLVGVFFCSDCGMNPGAIDPDTQGWISTVVNNYNGGSWITSDGQAKYFTNCNNTTCIRWTYVKAGTFVGTPATIIRSVVKFKAIGSFEGGASIPPNNNGGGGGGGGSNGGGYWEYSGSSNICFEYFSDGTSTGVICSDTF